jgi:hypothetical protein
MGYEISLKKAWEELESLSEASFASKEYEVEFLCNAYRINVDDETVLCQLSGKPADEFVAVLALHYLIGLLKHGYSPSGDWISFKEIWGGNSFYPAFRESTLKPLVENLGRDPHELIRNLVGRLGGRIVEGGDISIEVPAFPGIFIRIIMWYGDEELLPEATMVFDRNLAEVISTEDIAVLLNCIVETALAQQEKPYA